LLEKSSKARENGPTYARLTVERAAAAVSRTRHGQSTMPETAATE